jgi:GH15 family glucan-1,4-alpha-glucosidase
MLHSTRLTWPEIRVVYDVHGEVSLRERELSHLEGYRGSRPVRTGNGAVDQFQLDVYGEVADAVFEFIERGGRLDRATAALLVAIGRTVCRRWREPDHGIWEIRGGRRHHTYSKAMCWVALDRLIRLHEAGHLRAPSRHSNVSAS